MNELPIQFDWVRPFLLKIGKEVSAARYAAPVDGTVVQVVLDNQN
jgi:hypothetical protein